MVHDFNRKLYHLCSTQTALNFSINVKENNEKKQRLKRDIKRGLSQ